jgi:hypothetical protein
LEGLSELDQAVLERGGRAAGGCVGHDLGVLWKIY